MSDAVNKPAHYNQGSIECIDAMKIVLTQEEFRGYLKGNVFKYLWREKDKNGNEDLRKGKSYYDSLIELVDEIEAEQLATGEVTGEGTEEVTGEVKPPDGWRWLEFGEKFFFGDTTVDRDGKPYLKSKISKQYCERHTCQIRKTFIRRNRFEVGEKVIDCRVGVVFTVQYFNKEYSVVFVDGVSKGIESKHLAPYIEETK